MELLLKFIENILILANSMSLFVLLGLLIAGVLKELIPADFISRHLGGGKVSSVIKATLLGIPMPVCSCSVIPLAKSLQKEGANKGAVQSFLIATPITGADSIMATYSFFGWIFTLYRVVTSVFIAIVAGILQNSMDEQESAAQKPRFGLKPSGMVSQRNSTFAASVTIPQGDTCCDTGACCDDKAADKRVSKEGFSPVRVLRYAFVTLFGDIYFSLFVGILLGAVFGTLLPKELLAPLFSHPFLTYYRRAGDRNAHVCLRDGLSADCGGISAERHECRRCICLFECGSCDQFSDDGRGSTDVWQALIATLSGSDLSAEYPFWLSLRSLLWYAGGDRYCYAGRAVWTTGLHEYGGDVRIDRVLPVEEKIMQYNCDIENKKLINRVNRIEGQVKALKKRVNSDLGHQDPHEVIRQLSAIRGAVNGMINSYIEHYAKGHLVGEMRKAKDEGEAMAQMDALIEVMKSYAK